MDCGIYKITIGPKNYYIGSSKMLIKREKSHRKALKSKRHQNKRMQHAWNKYQEFTFEVIEYCDPDVRLSIEQRYIDLYFKDKKNMNLSHTAGGGCRDKLTESHKKKIANSLTGHKRTDAEKQKLKYKRSAETIEKMTQAQRNKSPETIAKISNTLKGHSVLQETREKIRQKCRKLSDDQIREIKKMATETKNTQAHIAKVFGVSRTLISFILSGKVWAEVI